MSRRGLGRGLEVLIPGDDEASPKGIQRVAIEEITPNPHQPRSPFREQDVVELAASIEEHGIIQPLVVTTTADQASGQGYQLIAGERRWRAARLAGLTEVPVIIKDVAPREMLELALVENVQRADLNALEEAQAYHQLAEEFGLSHTEIAKRVGKSRSAISNTLRLLQGSEALRAALLDEKISEGHARALLGLPDSEVQDVALEIVLTKGLNVRQTEALVKHWQAGEETEKDQEQSDAKSAPSPEIRALEDRFQEALNTRVRLKPSKKGGRVVIYYYSDEEFNALYQQLIGDEL